MIKIYSTFSKDTIFYENKNCVIINKSGPAFFIEKIFKKYKIKYKLYSGNIIEVEIKITSFVAIIFYFLKINNIVKSMRFATKEVEEFLNNNF